MTSNIGSPVLLEGIDEKGRFLEGVREKVMTELRHHFRPEFLNRVDETVLFRPLLADQIAQIVDLQLQHLRRRLEDHKIELELTGTARTYIAQAAYDPAYGARPLKRYLQHELETPLARAIISGIIHDGWKIRVDMSLVDSPDTDAPLRFGRVTDDGGVQWLNDESMPAVL